MTNISQYYGRGWKTKEAVEAYLREYGMRPVGFRLPVAGELYLETSPVNGIRKWYLGPDIPAVHPLLILERVR